MNGRKAVAWVASALLVSLIAASDTTAQPHLLVSAGPAPYDLSGTGTSGIAAIRVDVPLVDGFEAQAGAAFFWYTTQAGSSEAMLIPEMGFVAGVPRTPLYVSVGGGHTLSVRGDGAQKFELYAGIGARLRERSAWTIRPEVRLHNVDPWVGTIVELGFGIGRRL